MKSPFKGGSSRLPDPQVKGDFDALLSSDSGKSATTKQPPVLLDLRKSGSFKPQNSLDSAASFATAPSSTSDVVSEAAGPTQSSVAPSPHLSGSSNAPGQGTGFSCPLAKQQLLQQQSSNGVSAGIPNAGYSAAEASHGIAEFTDTAARARSDSMRGSEENQGVEQSFKSSAASDSSTPEAQLVGVKDLPQGSEKGTGEDVLRHRSQGIQETAHSASAADSPADESGMPGQESIMPGTQLQQDINIVEDPHHESPQGSKALSMANLDSQPLQPHSSDAALASSKAPRAPKQGSEDSAAASQDPLQSCSAGHGARDGSAHEDVQHSGTPVGKAQHIGRDDDHKAKERGSLMGRGLHDHQKDSQKQQNAAVGSRDAPNGVLSQRKPTALQVHSDHVQAQPSAAAGLRHLKDTPAQSSAAAEDENYEDAYAQLASASGQEPSEELPVSTLGARCFSGVMPESLPAPASSSAEAVSSANGQASSHDDPAGEPGEGHAQKEQDSEGEELKEWRPADQELPQLDDLPREPEQGSRGAELQGAASLGSSTAYELKIFDPHGGDNTAVLQQPHHVRHASTCTESLGGHTNSEVGTAPGELEDDYSVIAPSEASSAPIAAQGADASAMQRASSGASSLGRAATHAAAEVLEQDEHSADWRNQRKHFFVLSNAGRPVFTAHGSEHALAGFMAIIDAMMSFVKDRGDSLVSMRSGEHLIVFLEKGPLYLVAVSSADEPESALRLQLDLLHAHFLAILTDNFDKMLARNPRFEPRRLLGGTEDVLRRFLESFESSPAAMLGAFEPLHLPSSMRHNTLVSLQSAVKRSDAMYGILLAGKRVVALAQPRAHALHAHDTLLLSSFVLGSDSFRAAAESFSPICLPCFNPAAFLHAYVRFLDEASGLCLVLLSTHQDAFHNLSDAAKRLQADLQDEGTFQVIARTLSRPGSGRLCLDRLPRSAGGGPCGETALHHFLYRATARAQFVMPAFSPPLNLPELRQEVMPAYARAHAAVHDLQGAVRQRVHFCRTDRRVVLAYVGAEYEVFAQFDALTDRSGALAMCQRLCAYIKNQQSDLFVPMSL